MKPGIYLIEVKECEQHAEWTRMVREAAQGRAGFIDVSAGMAKCPHCDGRGYIEERIDAEAWLAEQLKARHLDEYES